VTLSQTKLLQEAHCIRKKIKTGITELLTETELKVAEDCNC